MQGTPAISYADTDGEVITLGCGRPSMMPTQADLAVLMSERVRNAWNMDTQAVHMALGTRANLNATQRMQAAIWPGADTNIQMSVIRPPNFAADDPSATLRFRAGQYDGALLAELPAVGLDGPLTELLRTCSAWPSSPGAPSFSCIGGLLQQFGETQICADPAAAEADGAVLAGYIAATEPLAPAAKAAAWTRYRRWLEDRLACGRDMGCVVATAAIYMQELPSEPTPNKPEIPVSAALALLNTPEALAAEAALHGIPAPTLRFISGRTAYVTPGCDFSCAANIYAIHDVGPDETVPLDPAEDLAAVAAIGQLYGFEVKVKHLRLGHPLPARDAESGVPAIATANYQIDPQGRAKLTFAAAPGTWSGETSTRETAAEIAAARLEAERREREERLARFFVSEAARRERLMAAGHVYRAPEFWSDFFYPDTIRTVFEGGRLSPDAPALRQLVGGFVVAINAECRAHIPNDAVSFSQTAVTRVVNGFGIEMSRTSATSSYRVHRELAPFFRRMTEEPPTASETIGLLRTVDDLLSGRIDLEGAIAPVAGHAIDAQRLVRSFDCRSAAMQQFFSALAANANGTATPIEAGHTFPGSAAESDPALEVTRASSHFDACMRASGYSGTSLRRCACVGDDMSEIVDSTIRPRVLADFEPFAVAWFHGGFLANTAAGRAYQQCVAATAR
ncbi:MAG: hypothetical protein AAF626_04905 [Pseudomonadota bacterium]